MRNDICLLFVTFNPTPDDIAYVNGMGKVYHCVVADNSEYSESTFDDDITVISNRNKDGIAGAQNKGLESILGKNSFSYVVFFDQDSRVDNEYPERIAKEYKSVANRHLTLAILGPTVVHKDTNEEYKSVIHKDVRADDGFIRRREIISSGSCVSVEVLKAVGTMDSRLFIDFVDFEWCWRAESKGYICGITKNVFIRHQVGSRELKFPKGYRVILSAPFRYYYQYRNHLLLCRRRYVPFQWKVNNGIKHAARLVYFPLLGKQGRKAWKFMVKGIIKGLCS